MSASPPIRRPEQESSHVDAEEEQPQHEADSPGITDAPIDATDADAVVALLVEHGVTPRTARDLVAAHPIETIRQQIEWHQCRGTINKNPAGALVRAIHDGWAPPAAWSPANGRAAAPVAARPTLHHTHLTSQVALDAPPPQVVPEPPLSGLWGQLAAVLRPTLSDATYAAFVAPVLQAAPELPLGTRDATLLLPSAFALEKWHRPPIQAAVAAAAASLGLALTLHVAAPPDGSNTAAR